MSTSNSTSNRILQASKKLRNATKITSRREAANQLLQLLTSKDYRKKLKKEAIIKVKNSCLSSSSSKSDEETSTTVNRVIRKVYRAVMEDVINATSDSLKSKVKLTQIDLNLPLKVLNAIDSESDLAISSLTDVQTKGKWFYVPEPFTFESFNRYRDTNSTLTYLSNKDINLLLNYCLVSLRRRDLCDIAEQDLFNLLLKLCSRSDYVSAFGTSNDLIFNIIEEIHTRMISNISSTLAKTVIETLYNLVHHLVVKLGIDIQMFVRPCLGLILDCIKNDVPSLSKHIYGIAVDVMATYPELCSSIFKDDENMSKLYSYATKCWSLSRHDRDVFVGYFSAHLLICETAGHLQGMFPGDLGDIGSASINEQKLAHLAEMLLSQNSLKLFCEEDFVNNTNKSRHGGDVTCKFTSLTKRQRRYLELCARVLRIYQRYFLMREERNASTYLIEDMIEEFTTDSNSDENVFLNRHEYDGLSSDRCIASIENLSSCPWVEFLMKFIHRSFSSVDEHTSNESSTTLVGSIELTDSMSENVAIKEELQSVINTHPMKEATRISVYKSSQMLVPNVIEIRIYLQIICACAEVFPRGECWSSNNEWYKSKICPFDSLRHKTELNNAHVEVSYCNACSCSDMASLIHSVTDVLCHYGNTSGDLQVKRWTLICLLKLTEASIIAANYWEKSRNTNDKAEVSLAWRRVWETIFRHDLRYSSYTSNASTSSLGELVLMLLTEIIKGHLTSMNSVVGKHRDLYVMKEQDKVWSLPVFKSVDKIYSSAPFELMSTVLNIVGLVEGHNDAFVENKYDSYIQEMVKNGRFEELGRRFRIMSFVASFLKQECAKTDDSVNLLLRVTPFATSCLVSLSGNRTMLVTTTTYTMQSMRIFRASETHQCFYESGFIDDDTSLFSLLWKDVIEPFSFQFDIENDPQLWDTLNGRDVRLCKDTQHFQSSSTKSELSHFSNFNANSISPSRALKLQSFAFRILLDSIDERSDELPQNEVNLICKTIIIKCIIVVRLLNNYDESDKKVQWRHLEETFESVLGDILSQFQSFSTHNNLLSMVLSNVIGLFRFLRECLKSGHRVNDVRGLMSSRNLKPLLSECAKTIKSFPQCTVKDYDEYYMRFDCESDDDDAHDNVAKPIHFNSQSDLSSDDDLNDREDGENITNKRKMKIKEVFQSKKQKIKFDSGTTSNSNVTTREQKYLNDRLTWLCAYLLIILEPSVEICNTILNSIIWPQEEMVFDSSDPHDCVLCLGLFHNYVVLSLIDERDKDKISIFSLCMELIYEGRSSASASSPYHMLGFKACGNLIESRMKFSCDLSPEEIEDIVRAVYPETLQSIRSLKNRPLLRTARVHAAIKCFLQGNEAFHEAFDLIFEKSIVLEALIDQSHHVRRIGAAALGAALDFFSSGHTNIVLDVLKILPPLEYIPNVSQSTDTYTDWVKKRIMKVSRSVVDFAKKAWEECHSVIQSDILYCIGVIIGKISLADNNAEMIFQLLMVKSLENYRNSMMSFRCLEYAAAFNHFENLEVEINVEEAFFIKQIIFENRTFLSMPVTLCCPGIIRCIMRIGCHNNINFGLLQKHLTEEYVLRNVPKIIPRIFIHNDVQKREKYISEIASVCVKGDISKLIRSHIHDIYSIALIMLFDDESEGFPHRKNAEDVLLFIKSFPKIGLRHVTRSSHLIVMQIVSQFGRKLIDDDDITSSCCLSAIKYFVTDVLCRHINSKESIFNNAGSSVIECLLHSRGVLDKSSFPSGRKQAWRMIKFVVDQEQAHLRVKGALNLQVGFCFNTLLSMILDDRNKDLQQQLLSKLKELFYAVTEDDSVKKQCRQEISSIINKLFLTMIQVHEEISKSVLQCCLDHWRHHQGRKFAEVQLGEMTDATSFPDTYLSYIHDADIISKSVDDYGALVPLEQIASVSLAYDILYRLFEQRKGILSEDLQNIGPLPTGQPEQSKSFHALTSIDEKFGLKNIIDLFVDFFGLISNQSVSDARMFETIAVQYIANKARVPTSTNTSGIKKNDIDSHRLLSSIDRLQQSLPLLMKEAAASHMEESQVLVLVSSIAQHLFGFCNSQCPHDIQIAAGSCLGSIIPILHDANITINQIPPIYFEKRKFSIYDPFDHLFRDIFERIVKYMLSDDTETAIIAKDTLKSVVSTADGQSLWKEVGLKEDVKRIVFPIISTELFRYSVDDVVFGFYRHLKKTLKFSELELTTDSSWCWSDKLWQCSSKVPFEDWIRNIVCSLLICSYKKEKKDQTHLLTNQGSSNFLQPCLKLCTREHEFAAAVFPAVLFDILCSNSEEDTYSNGGYLPDRPYIIGSLSSLANKTITRCLINVLKPPASSCEEDTLFLGSGTFISNEKAVHIVVKFLDFLRCVTEHDFYSSKHQTNKTRIPGRSYDVKKGVVKIDDSIQEYNNLPPTQTFFGRPYGVVLDLQGTELPASLIRLKDFPSALYYSELFADNRLGGSGCIFEMLHIRAIQQCSLSGFGNEIKSEDNVSIIDQALLLQKLLRHCYISLHEQDNLLGLEEQTSILRFESPEHFDNEKFSLTSHPGERALTFSDTALQMSCGRGIADIQSHISVISSLSNMGLHNTLKNYLVGLTCNQGVLSSLSDVEYDHIKEKWAEESWRMMQWDDKLLPAHIGKYWDKSMKSPISFFDDEDFPANFMKKSDNHNLHVGYHESLSKMLLPLREGDVSCFLSSLRQTRLSLLDELQGDVGTTLPSNGLYSFHCLKFMTLNEFEDLGSVLQEETSPSCFVKKWCFNSNLFLMGKDLTYSFNELETAMACHEISLKLIFHKFGESQNDDIGKSYLDHLKRFCSFARKHGRPSLARSALKRLRHFIDVVNVEKNDTLIQIVNKMNINLEEARIMYCSGDTTAAVSTCKLIISSLEKNENMDTEEFDYLRCEALLQCGTWLVKHKIDSAVVVLNQFLSQAADQALNIHKRHDNDRSVKLLMSTHFALAEFVANLYDSVEIRINSPEWRRLVATEEGRRKELAEIEQMLENCTTKQMEFNLRIEKDKMTKEVEMDMRERIAVEDSVSQYLRLALRTYGDALTHGIGILNNSKHLFRFVSLWFRNCNGTGKGGNVNALVASKVGSIPSFHFVPLIYQIFSRIDVCSYDEKSIASNEKDTEFQFVLSRLIARICKDHPYHGIIQLIALSNGRNVIGRHATTFLDNVGNSKVEASSNLLRLLEKGDPDDLAPLIQSYKIVIDAYIDLAIAPTKQYSERKITKNIPIRDIVRENKSKYQPLDTCLRRCSQRKPCVLTQIPAIRPGTDYGDGTDAPVGSEFIKAFDSKCSITETGIHRPKIIMCIGSNGGKFKQLVKGDDDIRQDAIMQQVFQTVNNFFQFHQSTNMFNTLKGNMKLHTYNCIPLSPSAGILQWVDNTVSFGDFLYRSSDGKKVGAHEKYYPGEWDVSLCRKHYMCSPRDEKRASFDQICKNYSPCFRFFFLERFGHSPQQWHDARMTYIRSSAINSIVGHILGIGDRHSHNILIHEKTGEVVHIDFGIVFEQGKLLTTPETVPFRLTRDIVDGFGPTGTDGAFTVAAQATTEVLRENTNALITVLSAVVSDPLYSWSVNPVKARRRQHIEESMFGKENSDISSNVGIPTITESDNDAATRTIAKINEKLQGYEEGTFGEQQTVEGQVRLLINAARNPDNLCSLFVGWMPWL